MTFAHPRKIDWCFCANCERTGCRTHFCPTRADDRHLRLWRVMRALRLQFVTRTAPYRLYRAWNIPADPRSPLRVCFYNQCLGLADGGDLRETLWRIGFRSWHSGAPKGACWVLPIQIYPGWIVGFRLLYENGCDLLRANGAFRNTVRPYHLFPMVLPTGEYQAYANLESALHDGARDALFGFRGIMLCPS